MDPYHILGLSYPSTKEEIRSRYLELAKKHHPDKLAHLSEEERKAHEETFKKISVAYELLNKKEFNNTSQCEWTGIWSYMENFMNDPNMLRNMSDLLKNVVDIAREYKKQKGSEHHIKIEVSLEEVHLRKEKKLRLFLKNIQDPIFITVDCGCYPSFLYTHITPNEQTLFIHLDFVLKQHDTYVLDDLFEPYDLVTEVNVTLYEYFTGGQKSLIYLDGSLINYTLLPYSLNHILIENKGLYEKGTLRILTKICVPTKEEIAKVDLKTLEKIINNLKLLYSQTSMM
uniref:J domain-containing protein n=1 Tax=viral metagenome TaxID=1070528 RepID=A0A6C0CTN1_9ZZZZ